MKSNMNLSKSIAAAVAIASAVMAPGSALAARRVTLNSGSVIAAKLNDALSSNESRQGDSFTATLNSAEARQSGLPAGTQIQGVVRSAQPKDDKHPGILDLTFQRLLLPDGKSYGISGSLIGLDNKSVTRNNGRLVATKSHKNDRLTYVGYGAGAGLLIGVLARKQNVLADTAIGAGLGYLAGALQKHHSDSRDVALKQGSELGIRLDRSLSLSSY